jgi:hypothetical protein
MQKPSGVFGLKSGQQDFWRDYTYTWGIKGNHSTFEIRSLLLRKKGKWITLFSKGRFPAASKGSFKEWPRPSRLQIDLRLQYFFVLPLSYPCLQLINGTRGICSMTPLVRSCSSKLMYTTVEFGTQSSEDLKLNTKLKKTYRISRALLKSPYGI